MTTKKPLFSRPAWASSGETKTVLSPEEPIFGRQRIYDDILELERKERERKEKRTKAKTASNEATLRPSKKRRVSTDHNDQGNSSDSSAEGKARKRIQTPEVAEHKPVTRSTPRTDRLSGGLDETSPKRNSPRNNSKPTIITLGEDDGEDEISRIKSATRVSPAKSKLEASPAKSKARDQELLPSDDDDDPYLQELKAKAREKQRLQRLGMENYKPKTSPTPALDLNSPFHAPEPFPFDDDFPEPGVKIIPPNPGPATSPPEDPEVQIYINPLIPNTKALIVGRRASQNLEPVKTFWCKKQGLPDTEAAKVFFTWRDIKLFNSSTMRHIVDRLNKEKKPGQDDSEGKIIVDAVTQEIFDYQQAEKARRDVARASAEDDTLEEEMISPPAEPEKGKKFIIRLQSKEYGEMPIRIRPESTVSKIAGGFMQQMVPGPTKTPYLIFDGDRLEGEQTAQEVGLEDGDVVEVQFR